MLAKSTRLRHPSGVEIDTPLLVPSISSKGFGFDKESGLSEVSEALQITSEYLTDTMLVSAYDVYYNHLPDYVVNIAEITLIDSGGYETSHDHDLSAVRRDQHTPRSWTEDMLDEVLFAWPSHAPAVVVNPDRRSPVREQIESARAFFSRHPGHLTDLLLKSFEGQPYIELPAILEAIHELHDFSLVGFTEKELGPSMLARMRNIAIVRRHLNEAGLPIPLHIFGSLDPVTSVLYFLAGAEVFDGLTWLRYAYLNGTSVYWQDYGVFIRGIEAKGDFIRAMSLADNLGYLQKLKIQMKRFLAEDDFNVFDHHADQFEQAYKVLLALLD